MKTNRRIGFVVMCVTLGICTVAEAATPLNVCIAKNGKITAEAKCSGGKSALTATKLKSACSNTTVSGKIDGTGSLTLNCPSGMNMMSNTATTDTTGSWPSGSSYLFPGGDFNKAPAGILVDFDSSPSIVYSATVEAVCCKSQL